MQKEQSVEARKMATQSAQETLTRPGVSHLLNVLKAGLASTPFLGGIASLITDYIPSSRENRLDTFTKQIADDLYMLQDKVDQGVFESDEFAFLFEKCYRGVAESYQSEKLEAFRGILVNSAVGVDLSCDEREYFLNLVSTLSVLHLRIIWFLGDSERYLVKHGIPTSSISGGFSSFMPRAIPGVSLEVIKSAFGELYRYGLISTDRNIFGMVTVGQGFDLLGDRITDHGRAFLSFCSSPAE